MARALRDLIVTELEPLVTDPDIHLGVDVAHDRVVAIKNHICIGVLHRIHLEQPNWQVQFVEMIDGLSRSEL